MPTNAPTIRFVHARRCTGEEFTEETRPNGDVKRTCLGCDKYLIVYLDKRRGPKRPALPVTGYVCRDHHHQPVTWRGTGCPECSP